MGSVNFERNAAIDSQRVVGVTSEFTYARGKAKCSPLPLRGSNKTPPSVPGNSLTTAIRTFCVISRPGLSGHDTLARMRTNIHPDDIIGEWKPMGFRWGSECDPAGTPLKTNALRTLRPELSAFGFATGPVQRRKSFFRLPIHWIYRPNRIKTPFRYYEPVGAVVVPCLEPDAKLTFAYTWTCAWRPVFSQFFDRYLESWRPEELFSQEGLTEIRRFSHAVRTGKRCAEPAKILRHEWVRRHSELWDDLPALLAELRRFRLYSSSTPKCQAIEHLRVIVERVRNGKGAEDLVQTPQSSAASYVSDHPEWSYEELVKASAALEEKFANLPPRRGRGPSKSSEGPQPSQ